MYVKVNGHIEVIKKDGKKISFDAFNAIEIEHDIFKINSICKLKIPAKGVLVSRDKKYTEKVETARKFERGDKIKIWLGYNDRLKEEFSGFVYRVNYTTPVELECEGFEFLLRSPCHTRTWKSTNMKEVLRYILSGTGIKLDAQTADVSFTKFILPNMTKLEALQLIKDKYGMTIYFNNDTLYAGLAYLPDKGKIKYKLGENTIKDDNLKYRNEDDVSLRAKAIWIKPDNTKIEAQVGDPKGNLRTLFFYNIKDKKDLEAKAKEELKKYKYSGYEGKITTFLEPSAKPGMKGELIDVKYRERDGTYYITKVNIKADTRGARRTIEFTIKLQK